MILWKLKLRNKLILVYAPVILLSVILCFIYFAFIVNREAMTQICETQVTMLKNISNNLEYTRRNIVNISNTCMFNEDIARFVNPKSDETDFERSQRYSLVKELLVQQSSTFYNMDYYTTIVSFNGVDYITNSLYDNHEYDLERVKALTENGVQDKDRLIWTGLQEQNGKQFISAFRYIIDRYTGEATGMMIFDFDEVVFAKTYSGYIGEAQTMLLTTVDGELISSSKSKTALADYNMSEWFGEFDGYKDGYFFSEENTFVAFVKLYNPDWYLILNVPKQSLYQTVHNMPSYGFGIALLLAVVFLLITVLLSNYISKPIKRLTSRIAGYQSDSNSMTTNAPNGDEIAYLTQEYELMIERIDLLIKNILLEQDEKRKFEMQALQSQINPHFLYNTLNVIRMLNKTKKNQAIDETIQALVRLLSSLFRDTGPFHTIKEECEQLKDYLFIQQTRHGDSFTSAIHCDNSLESLPIAKLLIQPIVENSVFHGMTEYESGGLINIYICAEPLNKIKIIVEDNGGGFPENELETLLNEDDNSLDGQLKVEHGIGLRNTFKRLRLLYGKQANIEIENIDGGGSRVVLHIPAIYGEEEKA